MKKKCIYSPKPIPRKTQNPFDDTEQAWFWFIRCLKLREDGAQLESQFSLSERPCEPDDIYRITMRLFHQKKIHKDHLKTLTHFGLAECPPNPQYSNEQRDARLWDQALDLLHTPLCQKGIVVTPDKYPDMPKSYTESHYHGGVIHG